MLRHGLRRARGGGEPPRRRWNRVQRALAVDLELEHAVDSSRGAGHRRLPRDHVPVGDAPPGLNRPWSAQVWSPSGRSGLWRKPLRGGARRPSQVCSTSRRVPLCPSAETVDDRGWREHSKTGLEGDAPLLGRGGPVPDAPVVRHRSIRHWRRAERHGARGVARIASATDCASPTRSPIGAGRLARNAPPGRGGLSECGSLGRSRWGRFARLVNPVSRRRRGDSDSPRPRGRPW